MAPARGRSTRSRSNYTRTWLMQGASAGDSRSGATCSERAPARRSRVVSVQIGYLVGGLRRRSRRSSAIRGIGQLDPALRPRAHDLPIARGGVLLIATRLHRARTSSPTSSTRLLNPRVQAWAMRRSRSAELTRPTARSETSPAGDAPPRALRGASRCGRRRSVGAARSSVFWVLDALLWRRDRAPRSPSDQTLRRTAARHRARAHSFGTDNLGPRRLLAGARGRARRAHRRAARRRCSASSAASRVGLDHRLLPRPASTTSSAASIDAAPGPSRWSSSPSSPLPSWAPRSSTSSCFIGATFTPLDRPHRAGRRPGRRERQYVAGARLRGSRRPYIMFAEILPNILGPIVVEATVRLGYAVFTAATLSFLGLGLQPPSPDWGLRRRQHGLTSRSPSWTVLFPALALAIAGGRRQPDRRRARGRTAEATPTPRRPPHGRSTSRT